MHATLFHLALIAVLVLVKSLVELDIFLLLHISNPVLIQLRFDFAGGFAVVRNSTVPSQFILYGSYIILQYSLIFLHG